MAATSPAVAGWQLGRRLRERRLQLNLDPATISKKLGFTKNYWSLVENERAILSEEKLHRLMDIYEWDEAERKDIVALRQAAKQRGWWASYSALFDRELLRFFGYEQGTESVRTYENLIVPGLLQTPAYMRALMQTFVTVRPVEIDRRVQFHLQRQQRLLGDDPLKLTAVISEAALHQQVGGPEVLREQLLHMVQLIEQHPHNVEMRVIPFTVTNCGVFGSSTFHLLGFADPSLPTLGWQETVAIWGMVDDETKVRELEFAYADASGRTLSRPDSRDLILRRIEELTTRS